MTVYAWLLIGIVVYGVILAFLSWPHPDDEFWDEVHAEQDRRDQLAREAQERKARSDLYGRSF